MVNAGASPPNVAEIRAVLHWKDVAGNPHELNLQEGDTAQLGRDATNDLVVEDEHISRHHAVINWRETAFEIADLGSVNGTIVNGAQITRPQTLKDGDRIRLYETDIWFSWVEKATPKTIPKRADRITIILPPDTPQPHLIISSGPEEGRQILLQYNKMVIGRATIKASWDIPLQDRAISRPHAQFQKQGTDYILSDLGSANGTLLNEEPLMEPTTLKDGDVIKVGETTLLFRSR